MAYYDDIVHYLTDGYWEHSGGSRRKFDVEPGGTLTVNITGLTPAGQYLARVALDSWTLVSGIQFQEVSHNNADIRFSDDGEGAWSRTPVSGGVIPYSVVNVSEGLLRTHGTGIDSYSFQTYIHEIGHALGLGHPGPYNGNFPDFLRQTISFDESWQVTVMSYISQPVNIFNPGEYAHVVTPMAADIAAIHELYGKPDEVNGGNTRYGYRPNTGTHMDEYFELWVGEGNPFSNLDFTYIREPFFFVTGGEVKGMTALSWDRKTIYFYENKGTPAAPDFVYDFKYEFLSRVEDYEFVDLTNDGAPGLVVSHADVLLVMPTADIGDAIIIPGDYLFVKLDVVDIDNDGDKDIVEVDGFNLYFRENTGTPSAPRIADRALITTFPYPVSDFEFEDLDSDNDYDMILVDTNGVLVIFENNGTPRSPSFTGEIDVNVNPLQSTRYGEFPSTIMRDFAFVDLDNDNDLDFVVVDSDARVQYFENTGSPEEFHFNPTSFNRSTTFTIYDTGGTDWLDVRTDTYGQWIDLTPGGVSSIYDVRNNVIIAHDTIIENVFAGQGDDMVFGNQANNRIYAGPGHDMVFGNDGDDQLWGRSGDDVLRGDNGDDEIIGGPGHDLLIGGLGADTFVFSPRDGNYADHIADFRHEQDKIDLTAFDDISSVTELDYYWHDETQTSTYIDLTEHGGGKIVLEGYTDSIYGADFIFADDPMIA